MTFTFGWFSSGRGQGSIDLLRLTQEKIREGFIPGQIAFVFCDREPHETPAAARFHELVTSLGLPWLSLSSRELREQLRQRRPEVEQQRQEYDRRVLELLAPYPVEVIVLAGYMLVLSPVLCQRYLCLNLHPALPQGPVGTWRQVIWQLMETEALETGAMLHLATPELDKGPPVAYCRFALRGPDWDPLWLAYGQKRRRLSLTEIKEQEGEQEPLFARIRLEGRRREIPLILVTLRSLATGALHLTPAGAVKDGRVVPGGWDLTPAVEEYLAANPQII